MDDNHLISSLSALVKRVSRDKGINDVAARRIIAKAACVSEQYVYQILTRKPMAGNKLRVPGREMREKISATYPDWLNTPESPPSPRVEQPKAEYQVKPHHDRALVQTLCDLAEQIDDNGLRELIGFARCLTGTNPLVKAKRA